MGLLQRREAGQDHVGVARGLVQAVVQADHGVELGKRGVEAVALRRREHRVAGDGDEPLELALAGRRDLLGQARDRHLPQHLGRAAHAALPAVEREALGELRRAQAGERPGQGLGEHGPALAVEVAGERVHHVDQPGGQRAELLVAGADAAVDGGPLRRGQLARQPADGLGRNRAEPGHRFGCELAGELAQLVDARDAALQVAERDETLVEENLHPRHQQRGVGAGPDRDPLVGALGGAGAAGIDDHHLSPALADGAEAAEHVGRRQQAALGGVRVCAHHHEKLRAVDVGDGEGPHAAEQQRRRDVLRPLVDRAG